MVERSLSMREALGSMPGFSTFSTAETIPSQLVKLLPAPRTFMRLVAHKSVWPSGLRRQTQVLVEQSAWVRTPQLSIIADGTQRWEEEVLGGFEPPSLDSESRVLTVTPQDQLERQTHQ